MIRRAQKKDMEKIMDLLWQVNMVHHNGRPDLFTMGTKYTSAQLEEMLTDDQRPIFVLTDESDAVIAYAFCVFERHINDSILTDVKTLYIDDLCVDEAARGKHAGKTLYNYVCDFAKSQGCYNLTLNVWSCNPGALKFYEACGLVPQKIHMEHLIEQDA